MKSIELLELESRKCFDFFWREANVDVNSPGFGLIRDRAPGFPRVASIASVGFGLTAIAIGVERGWITWKQGFERACGTLDTLLNNAQQVKGFFYHFLNIETAKREWDCEVSIIDTAIAINGALVVGEYFGGEARQNADGLYKRVDWDWYRDPERNQFFMGYSPEKGFSGWWDFTAEQLMTYILGAASPTHPVNGDMFYSFTRHYSSYKDSPYFINSWYGSLFTHQFTHAWFDFRDTVDSEGVDWWKNSVIATKANRQYCIDQSGIYKTLGPDSWGLTACDGPWGYNGRYGASPSALLNNQHWVDGTVPPSGAAGSIVFTPRESIEALNYYYENFPELWGEYGFKDSYNLDVSPEWYARDVVGINKGITLIMIENYLTGLVWKYFMKNRYVQQGMGLVGVTKL